MASIFGSLRRYLRSRRIERLAQHFVPAIRLEAHPIELDDMAIGCSHLGGHPDVPQDFEWPTINGRPLQFLAQLNLKDFRDFEAASVLGDHGCLYFFYDASAQPWGFDPKDRSGWTVRYRGSNDVSALVRTEPPTAPPDAEPHPFDDLPMTFKAAALIGKPIVTLREEYLTNLDDETSEEVREMLWGKDSEVRHQLLGEPCVIQGDMQEECQLASNGIPCGTVEDYEDSRIPILERGAKDWRLLLQIDSDLDGVGWMWGDCGMLYFWIREQDCASHDFNQVWVVLQCY